MGKSFVVPLHNLECRPGSAVDLYCFIQENCADSIFKALVVSLSQHTELVSHALWSQLRLGYIPASLVM